MDLVKVIKHLRPESSHIIVDNDYDTMQWLSEGQPPSFDECVKVWPAVQAEIQNRQAKTLRQTAFEAEADPLYFGWQRGENTEKEWLDKVAEIRARHPYA